MAIFLVDFENVNSAGMSGVQKLSKEDKVYIFYTANAASLSFAAHLYLLSSPAEIIYYNVSVGAKNALDFQLSSFLGYLICQGQEKQFYIISNDKGYDHVKNFWETGGVVSGVRIENVPSINRAVASENPFITRVVQETQQTEPRNNVNKNEIPVIDKNKMPKKSDSGNNMQTAIEMLRGHLKNIEENDEETAVKICGVLKISTGKQQFYREILKIYGKKRGCDIYNSLRSEYGNLMNIFTNQNK